MRRYQVILTAAILGTSALNPLQPAVSTALAATTLEETQRSDLISSIMSSLAARQPKETTAIARNWISELQGFYRAPGAEALWVTKAGLSKAGLEMISELQSAERYGLDSSQFEIPASPVAADPTSLADAEVAISIAATKYAWHARGGRVDPSDLSLWLDQSPRIVYASDVISVLSKSADAAAALRSFNPQHPQFERLRQAYLAERGDIAPAPVELVPATGPKILVGDRHPDVVIARNRLGVPAADPSRADLFDSSLLRAVQTYMYEAGYGRKKSFDDQVRAALNTTSPVRPGANKARLDKMLVNLERWRWMPEKMGATHIWNNLPEFTTRVIRDGTVLHDERIIVGTGKTQTPVFSDVMSHVIFQPEWGVPESIKIRQLLPRLKAGDTGVLERRDMKVVDASGNKINANRIRWSKTDIRSIAIVQGAGSGNPLGRLKFIFPNGHDVYMHDTPDKSLFNESERTFSHGCMRVRNPDRYAEVILGLNNGWTASDVKRQLTIPKTTQIDLVRPIPIHITYFTMTADEAGNVASFSDIYGHDKRILDALRGTRSVAQIAAADPAMALKRENKQLESSIAVISRPKPAKTPAELAKIAALKGAYPPPSFFGFAPQPSPPKGLFGKPAKVKFGKPSYLKKASPNPFPFFGYSQ